ncbi:hypothetical protein FRB99_007921 [Tulasnella sp. 403]|nr:hypothetical protein FRB99_007921 [Tulasnella sp. 403]
MVSQWFAHLKRLFFKPKPALDQMVTGSIADNHLMVQFFEWESLPPEGISWWKHFENEAPWLASLGCTQVWLPPPNKAMVPWDLGEFDQKGSIATRWGTKAELFNATFTAKAHGIDTLIDAVLNHKLGADRTERFQAVEVDPNNRLVDLGPPQEIEGWTAFDFPGRGDKYSTLKWTQEHFTGLDWDQITKKNGIYKIVGRGHKGWSKNVDNEFGNYDYLLGIDIDFRHEAVRQDFLAWSEWILKETGAGGFRLDAAKHIDREFLREFVRHARKQPGYEHAFVVAEFWIDSVRAIERYMSKLHAPVSMFDVPLHHNFFRASEAGSDYDLRTILDGSLVQRRPRDAVTFVDNHDTAVGCSLESWVGSDFKPIAYALILLREGGHPCVYHADIYGPTALPQVPILMKARKQYAYGPTTDYFDNQHCIAFVRHGDSARQRQGCVVLCATGTSESTPFDKEIDVGLQHAKSSWKNLLASTSGETARGDASSESSGSFAAGAGKVVISDAGGGIFTCPPQGVAVWVREETR